MQSYLSTQAYLSTVTLGLLITFIQIETVSGSVGDNSQPFIDCLVSCRYKLCSVSDLKYAESLPFYMRWLQWNCVDECKYGCMWPTVEFFVQRDWPIPQFYGKWPFIRLWGVQEPMSTLFSILNGLSHIINVPIFWRHVPNSAPMYYVWQSYSLWPFTRCFGIQEPASVVFSILNAVTLIYNLWQYCKYVDRQAPLYNVIIVGNSVSVNAWLWSTVFHAKDTSITEMLDYFCAISLVIYSVFMLACRVFGTERPLKATISGLILVCFFVYHVHYLAFVKFDYGYNIKANVTVGVLNSIGWLIWCSVVRKRQPYVWKCALTIVLLNLLILLEVGDFPPIWWVFDAHSLWHAGTVPLPFIWYSFLIDDCNYLLKEKQQKKGQPIDATSLQTTEEVIKKIS